MQPKSALSYLSIPPFLMYLQIVFFSKLEPIKNHLKVVFWCSMTRDAQNNIKIIKKIIYINKINPNLSIRVLPGLQPVLLLPSTNKVWDV